jgi:uncharacterized protein (TIGR02996 family)
MSFHTHPEWLALLRGICAYPDDDLRRLVAADWLTEHGEEEYAEFVRLQVEKTKMVEAKACKAYAAGRCCRSMSCPLCPLHRRETDLCFMGRGLPDWFRRQADETYHLPGAEPPAGPACTLRRGFVAEVRAPLSWLIGGECEYGYGPPPGDHSECSRCHGTGRTPAHLDELVRCQPVTRVVVAGVEPDEDNFDGGFFWPWSDIGNGVLPRDLLSHDAISTYDGARVSNVFSSRESALDALSATLLTPARERAGLPSLHPAAIWPPRLPCDLCGRRMIPEGLCLSCMEGIQ